MRWLKDHGVTTNHEEYLELDYRVLEDCRLLMWTENQVQRRAKHYAKRDGDGNI